MQTNPGAEPPTANMDQGDSMAYSNGHHLYEPTSFNKPHLSPRYAYVNQKQATIGIASEYTPPLTPQTAQHPNVSEGLPDNFHNYLRAFHPFHPSSTISSDTDEDSVTVPINQGDVILVHTIEPNGWADGTLLESGARGWLPTNYCEAYDHDMIQNLLDALTYVWEFIRSHEDGDSEVFVKQDYVRAMIAGVRLLLERSDCLTRDAPLVKGHGGLRKLRKSILGDLAAFVKAAKALQEICRKDAGTQPEDIYDFLDSIVLKAFKVVTRAVKFLDLWTQDVFEKRGMEGKCSDNTPPLTPASEGFNASCLGVVSQPGDDDTVVEPYVQPGSGSPPQNITRSESQFADRHTSHRLSANQRATDSRPSSIMQKRTSVCHRLSYTGKSPTSRNCPLASARLAAAHENLLSSLGVFLGIHLQSRSSLELFQSTQAAVTSCQALLAVVNQVSSRDNRRSSSLQEARSVMETRLTELVQTTKDVLAANEHAEQHDAPMPVQDRSLLEASTLCIRAASNCVSLTNAVIERIGDFDFEASGLGISESWDQISWGQSHVSLDGESRKNLSQSSFSAGEPSRCTELSSHSEVESTHTREGRSLSSAGTGRNSTETVVYRSSSLRSSRSRHSQKPPSLELDIPPASPFQFPEPPSSVPQSIGSSRTVSVEASVADSTSSCMSSFRDSETSFNSTASTRVTTPDQSPVKEAQNKSRVVKSYGSSITDIRPASAGDCDDAEAQLLTTTYAHELVFTKDGQVSGGSLPALVERLTTHDSTPEAMFVNTFYLTFRLFTTPTQFAQALIDRFDYIGQSNAFATPVRLRVYNVFKGWLETHWRPDPDAEAIDIILAFANDKLQASVPSAGKRLVELISKVSITPERPLVPRLVSSMGKTNTALTSSIAPDAPMPNPVVTKSQLNLLRKTESGNASCSILDFDPLELARQFTIIESKIFCSIQPEELLASEWMKKTDSKAINVRAMSTLSTDLANLVADTILQPEEPKKRAVIIKQWIKIAKRCRELNNYDSLLAIICSLNSSMISRLKRTWDLITPKTIARLQELRSIVDCSRNYSNLRQLLQNHVAPCIPFVGIYLTDLTFVDVGNQTKRQLNRCSRQGSFAMGMDEEDDSISVINFDKHMKTSKIIGDLQRFQIPYRLAPVPEMQEWMEAQIRRVRSSEDANVQTFYRRSLLLEPRESQPQKPSPPIPDALNANTSFSSVTSNGSSTKEVHSSAPSTKEKFELWSARHFPHGMGHHKERVIS